MSRQSDSTNQPASQGHALPAKPPQSQNSGFAFKPRNVGASRPAAQSYARAPAVSAPSYPQAPTSYNSYPDYTQSYPAQSAYGGSNDYAQPAYGAGGEYGSLDADTEQAIQMQQWQANYGSTDKAKSNGNSFPLTPKPGDAQKTVIRQGGGQKWEDPTLLEWGDAHRMFVGNLAGEVTDDSLLKAFSKYPSVQKARVIRDKRTTKSKGFGFVSFTDADDFFQAAKEMQGKYIGSHPVLIKRAETDIKVTNKKDPRQNNHNKPKPKPGSGVGSTAKSGSNDAALAPKTGSGVQKKAPATKYKLLG